MKKKKSQNTKLFTISTFRNAKNGKERSKVFPVAVSGDDLMRPLIMASTPTNRSTTSVTMTILTTAMKLLKSWVKDLLESCSEYSIINKKNLSR